MTTHQKGYIGEHIAKLRFIEAGWNVAKPEIEDRYDLIVDDGTKLYRVQVKYVDHFVGDALTVDLRKECRNNGDKKRYTTDEIDAVVIYAPKTGKIYWIPGDVFENKSSISFRLEPTKNNQVSRVRFLKDFEWVSSSIGRARHS